MQSNWKSIARKEVSVSHFRRNLTKRNLATITVERVHVQPEATAVAAINYFVSSGIRSYGVWVPLERARAYLRSDSNMCMLDPRDIGEHKAIAFHNPMNSIYAWNLKYGERKGNDLR